jgi:predicted phosphodiesterase
MKRRRFLKTAFVASAALSPISLNAEPGEKRNTEVLRDTLSFDDHRLALFTRAPVRPTRVFHLTDTHLSLDDARGEPYRQYSRRMAGAYQRNTHFQTGETLTADESFTRTLKLAQQQQADFIVLTGDIFSFPSEAAIEWTYRQLKETGIPFAYVAGNHDWHYEGLPGSARALRAEWIRKRLRPMYQGHAPLAALYDLNGLRFVAIDDSTYEILPEQLDFFRAQVRTGIPFILLVHIPLYIPGRSVGYGCAHPDWGAQADKNYQIERRERWPEKGHTKTTLSFYEEVFRAPNLLAILAGHTHRLALDVRHGIPQVVGGANASGEYLDIQIRTVPGADVPSATSNSKPKP